MTTVRNLRDVAQIQPGYVSRARVIALPGGSHHLLQAKDISAEQGLRLETAVKFKPERNSQLYAVTRGDILVTARGEDHHAHLIDADLSGALASSVFYIVRPRAAVVLPGYLAWYLNQLDVQALLEAASRRTRISYIARATMENLSIIVPPINVQRRIVKTMDLWRQVQSVESRLSAERQQLIEATCRFALQDEQE